MEHLGELEKNIHIVFKEKDLLAQAFVHRSYLNEHKKFPLPHNERLEFLGDAVLELIVTEHLFRHYSNPEGELTNWRAALVNSRHLSSIAQELHLEKYLFLSKGEQKTRNTKAREQILANALEALIGAIYMDRGIKITRIFIEKFILSRLANILQHRLFLDAKSRFQETAQARTGITPAYRVLQEHGPDHARRFRVGLFLKQELVAEGEGSSKQEGEMDAAIKGLQAKGWEL